MSAKKLKQPRKGSRFDFWKVLGPAPNGVRGRTHTYCRCRCGIIRSICTSELVRKHVKSCGCINSNKTHHSWKGYGEIGLKFWHRIRANALSRGIKFEISIEWAWRLYLKQGGKCAITGIPIGFGKNCTASLDRIRKSHNKEKVPYKIGNVQWVHKIVNMMKRDLSEEEFVEWCRRVAK